VIKELKNAPATRRSTNPALTPRAQTVLGYLTFGIEEANADHPDIPAGKPLGPYDVAAILGVRRVYVRGLMANPVFKLEMARATADARAALEPKAVYALGELLDWQGEGRAADAGVRLRAAAIALNEDKANDPVSVNVNVTQQAAIRPGYIIRLPANVPLPQIIEGEIDDAAAPAI
jgi:hypothetical protein